MKVYKIIEQSVECDLDIVGVTLLSVEEADQLPIELHKYNNYWWLRSPGYNSSHVADVSPDGAISVSGTFVNFSMYAIRPALKISNLKSSNLKIGDTFEFGEKIFQIISESLAFCLTDIGTYCFKEDLYAENANDYEKSDVKKYVDDWFINAVKAEVER